MIDINTVELTEKEGNDLITRYGVLGNDDEVKVSVGCLIKLYEFWLASNNKSNKTPVQIIQDRIDELEVAIEKVENTPITLANQEFLPDRLASLKQELLKMIKFRTDVIFGIRDIQTTKVE